MSLIPLLRSAASATTTSVLSVSPSGPPGPGALVSDGLPFGPLVGTAALSSSSLSPTPINSLLYADDVALVGSASEVRHMLDLAQIHSLTLGYRWSPPKCAVLNAPTATSSRFVSMSLYGQDLPTTEEFTYLGVPFDGKGISVTAMIKHRASGTLAAMAQLHSMGLNRQGFPLLLSSRLFAAFIRPKLEYGLAIAQLTRKDYDELNRAQDRCLRMLVGGHRTASTVVLRHICNLPSMTFRADTLVLKFCRRSEGLPDDCLLSLLSQSVPVSLLSRLLHPQVLIRACRPVLRVDPILYLPASRADRSRLIRWRMGWIPGKPAPCSCGLGDTSRSHLMVCTLVPSALWCCLPVPPTGYVGHHIDYVLNLLPVSASARCPPFWSALCQILCHFDKICHPDIEYNSSSVPGQVWIDKSSAAAVP
ncbi:hypothetical protein G6F26_012620 [Rhizopus arrhizus]|nr:hypothetical protein G6F26_012620 [Rhizopus arrhizus]